MMNMNCIPFPFAFVLLTVITSQFSETLFPGEQPVKKQDNFKIKLLRFLSISAKPPATTALSKSYLDPSVQGEIIEAGVKLALEQVTNATDILNGYMS